MASLAEPAAEAEPIAAPDAVTVRFAGDSGDGMQLTGGQFTLSTALAGNDLSTFPDFPAEIRAPQGTLFGVSAFQINFGSREISTAGDAPDVLVAMNPAALKVNLAAVKPGGLVIVDTGEFTKRNLAKAKYDVSPLDDDTLAPFDVLAFDISALTIQAVERFGLGKKDALRSKNMWTLGLALWMFDRPREPIHQWLTAKFSKQPEIAEANIAALDAGHAYGETAEIAGPLKQVSMPPKPSAPGLYRTITGAEAVSLGLVAGAQLAELPMFFGGYPITPASAILHHLARLKEFGVTTFQAEDEIAAICAAIGASWAGQLGVTSSSGPGIALKTEAMGLAVMTELPLVIVNSQRGGPSTGLPTKTEQSDLYQAVYGRNGDAPMPVIACRSPSDAFDCAIEACRIAVCYMTPVMLLTDGYIANAAEPWKVPDPTAYEPFPARFLEAEPEGGLLPYARDEVGARPWIKPGTPGLMHRIGGIEKRAGTGNIDYAPDNHQAMTDARVGKVADIAVPDQEVSLGPRDGALAVVGWGSTYGPIRRAVDRARARGCDVSHIHVRHIWPLPANLGELLRGFDHVLVTRNEHWPIQDGAARPVPHRCRAAHQDERPALLHRRAGARDRRVLRRHTGQRRRRGAGERRSAAKPRTGAAMNAPVTIEGPVVETTLKDWETDQEVRWCPGCGDYAILKAVQRTLPELGCDPAKTVFISGIGCSSRFPYYMETYGFHTIHGRAPAVATGAKLANPELDVWLVTGDGDGLSIGGNHLAHVLRRNVNMQILLFNNEIYGLTKGQYSPTSREGTTSPSTPRGSVDHPANPCAFALGSGARFVARGFDVSKKLPEVLKAAHAHRGAAFVEIFQNCIVYNKDVFDDFAAPKGADENQLWLEHGEPMLFGSEKFGGAKGLALDPETLSLRVVPVAEGDWRTAGVRVHDVRNRAVAHLLAELPFGEFPMPLGVLYDDARETFEEGVIAEREAAARGKRADLAKLLGSGQTWAVEGATADRARTADAP